MRNKRADVRIFVSYAHRDPPLFRQLLESALRWTGVDVQLWTDEHVIAGTVPDQQIRKALDEMHIFVALITPMFDASEYIHTVEVPTARKRSRAQEVLVAPVLVSHPGGTNCRWLLSLERLPHKEQSWAEMRQACGAHQGEYDQSLRPLRDGVWKLVTKVRNGDLRGARNHAAER